MEQEKEEEQQKKKTFFIHRHDNKDVTFRIFVAAYRAMHRHKEDSNKITTHQNEAKDISVIKNRNYYKKQNSLTNIKNIYLKPQNSLPVLRDASPSLLKICVH